MIIKKGFITIIVLLGSIQCVFGGSENIDSSKIGSSTGVTKRGHAKPILNNNIDRTLLRPVDAEKIEEPSSNLKKERNVDDVLELLKTERVKLQELENKFKKLESGGVAKSEDVKNNTKALKEKKVVKIEQKTEGASLKTGTSAIMYNGFPKKEFAGEDIPDVKQYVTEDIEEAKTNINKKLIERLSKITKDASLLDIAESFYKLSEYDSALKMYKLLSPDAISVEQYVWAQYQIANCYRNMKKYDQASSEYQRLIHQYPNNYLIEQAKWYIDDINWWKLWYEKNASNNNQLSTAGNGGETR